MKAGDKVWYLHSGTQKIVEDIVECVNEDRNGLVYIHTKDYFCILGHDGFPTREALCEHYRKIFE